MSPQLLSITRQIATLPWRERLTLLWQILQSFLPFSGSQTQAPNQNPANLSMALGELQQICTEENYTLESPNRVNRINPFGDD
jgi:hypothetical protein